MGSANENGDSIVYILRCLLTCTRISLEVHVNVTHCPDSVLNHICTGLYQTESKSSVREPHNSNSVRGDDHTRARDCDGTLGAKYQFQII